DEFAPAQNKSVNLQLSAQQRAEIKPQLNFCQRERRLAGALAADADIFRDQSAQMQTQPRKFQFDSARMQRGDKTRLQKIRQADAVEPDERAQQNEQQQPHDDVAPAETNPAFAPKTRTHIKERSPEW